MLRAFIFVAAAVAMLGYRDTVTCDPCFLHCHAADYHRERETRGAPLAYLERERAMTEGKPVLASRFDPIALGIDVALLGVLALALAAISLTRATARGTASGGERPGAT